MMLLKILPRSLTLLCSTSIREILMVPECCCVMICQVEVDRDLIRATVG